MVGAYQAAINGWQQLAQIEELTSTNLLFRLAQAELESAIAIGRALEELVRIIAAAGRAIYDSVVGIGRFIKFAAIAAIAIGGTYVVYEFFRPSQKQPTQNPARRRRRRARGRPYGYLR